MFVDWLCCITQIKRKGLLLQIGSKPSKRRMNFSWVDKISWTAAWAFPVQLIMTSSNRFGGEISVKTYPDIVYEWPDGCSASKLYIKPKVFWNYFSFVTCIKKLNIFNKNISCWNIQLFIRLSFSCFFVKLPTIPFDSTIDQWNLCVERLWWSVFVTINLLYFYYAFTHRGWSLKCEPLTFLDKNKKWSLGLINFFLSVYSCTLFPIICTSVNIFFTYCRPALYLYTMMSFVF